MPVNPHVCRPERIRDIAELEEIIRRIDDFGREYARGGEVGVLMVQNRQQGAIYSIESRENAKREIGKPVLAEGPCE